MPEPGPSELQSASAEQICVLVQPNEAGKFQWDDVCGIGIETPVGLVSCAELCF